MDPTWPPETLESILRHSLPPMPEETLQLCVQAALLAVDNDRAAVMVELDHLAREFDAAGRPGTAKRVRVCAEKIAGRFK